MKMRLMTLFLCMLCAVLLLSNTACSVIAVADAAATVVSTGVKATAKTVGAVVDVVVPDGDDED